MPKVSLSSTDLTLHYVVGSAADQTTVDPSKPTLLLLHPGLRDLHYFDSLFQDEELRAGYNLIGFDSPAHGETSGQVTPNGTLERKARCLVEACEKLQFGPFHILGEGLCGTTIGMLMYTLRPKLIKSLLLNSPMHGYDSEDIRRDYRNALDMILADCGAGNTSFDPRAISVLQGLHQSQNTSAEAQADWVAKFQGRYGECSQDELLELFNPAVNRTPIPDAVLEDIRCPVLILAGSVDRATSPERAYELSESLSRVPGGADVHLIHNAPHWMTEAFPSIVIRFIKRFLERQSGQ